MEGAMQGGHSGRLPGEGQMQGHGHGHDFLYRLKMEGKSSFLRTPLQLEHISRMFASGLG